MLPEGFTYIPDFLTPAEEKTLLRRMESLDWEEVRMHGVVARRQVVHFGVGYTYDSRSVAPAPPAPEFLRPIIHRAARALGIEPEKIAEVLVTSYPPGAGIGWHRDAYAFGDAVFGVSLGSTCSMGFRRRNGVGSPVRQELQPRSAYILSGEARWEWDHTIPPVKGPRYSIMLRTLRESVKRRVG